MHTSTHRVAAHAYFSEKSRQGPHGAKMLHDTPMSVRPFE
jgi:hypothetical protein